MYHIFVVLLLIPVISSEECGPEACVNLPSCPKLQKLLTNPPESMLGELNKSVCNFEDDVKVCCKNFVDPPIVPHKVNRNENCGYQDSIYEFPWMASFMAFGWSICSGALINERYVLTAASCASRNFLGESLVNIILGDFNLKGTANCTDISHSLQEECVLFETYSIEDAIPHPLYKDNFNNIGLIRLNETVKYKDYIRPICLPTPSYAYSQPGDVLKTSGFVLHFDPALQLNRFKKNVSTHFVPINECQDWLNNRSSVKIPLTMFNTCSRDSSDMLEFYNYFVDHGGPIMKSHNNQWFVESVLALAYDDINPHRPIINTNISYYIDWIYRTMEPWD